MENKKGFRYLAKNVGLLTIGNFGTKLLTFFLVPLYTNTLSTTEYGTYDLFYTTVSLLIPILTLDIATSITRFLLDKNEKNSTIITYAFELYFLSVLIVILINIINAKFCFIDVFANYSIFFVLMYIVTALSGILTSISQGIERVFDTSLSGVISALIMIALNILFLVIFKYGLKGYFLATIIGTLSQCVYLICRLKVWNYIIEEKITSSISRKKTQKEMRNFSIPMIANSISWWINNASDRYIVTWLCGIAENGIYSVGYKIPSIFNVIQTIFGQAWGLSAIQDFDPEDKNLFFSKVYNLYEFVLAVSCSIIILFDKILAHFLYAKDFYYAWLYAPFLMISMLFGALAGFIGGIFVAVKDSKAYAYSTVVGAVCNLVLNIILVFSLGSIGAAIATEISYFVIFIMRLRRMKKYISMDLKLKRDFICYVLLTIQGILLLIIDNNCILYGSEIIILILIGIFFREEFRMFMNKLGNIMIKRRF